MREAHSTGENTEKQQPSKQVPLRQAHNPSPRRSIFGGDEVHGRISSTISISGGSQPPLMLE
jgi:hypothetical protein